MGKAVVRGQRPAGGSSSPRRMPRSAPRRHRWDGARGPATPESGPPGGWRIAWVAAPQPLRPKPRRERLKPHAHPAAAAKPAAAAAAAKPAARGAVSAPAPSRGEPAALRARRQGPQLMLSVREIAPIAEAAVTVGPAAGGG